MGHAAASLTWVVLGYISVVHSRHISGRFHKLLGYISLLSFLAHLACSIFNLYTDVVRHTPLPKLMLLYSAISSLGSMSRSIAAAIRRRPGWKLTHQDDMVTCYMDSIQGAGPIRMIAHVQGWMACGAVHCQWQYGGVATHCLWPYVFRLLCIATWTRYTNGLYVKMRGDEQLTRKYMRSCVKLAVLSGLVVAFSFPPLGVDLARDARWRALVPGRGHRAPRIRDAREDRGGPVARGSLGAGARQGLTGPTARESAHKSRLRL